MGSVHQGHRARQRKKLLENGPRAFADHELLEMLLYYAIPRRDTNELAHRLLERFGSLQGVFSAPVEELSTVEGVGENAAVLLSLSLINLYKGLCIRVVRVSSDGEE